ncbi:acyl--CoA ligase [Proteobacteria bacterium 005FR1]|nr:acyl--CoA ligase [Proteobacteria bacterium 005FR1]
MCESLADLLFTRATEQRDCLAVVHGDLRVSYGQLWLAVCAFAERLEAEGVSEGDRVVLFMNNGVEYIVAYYALVRLAAVPVPLNTGLKPDQLVSTISHAQSSMVLCADGDRSIDLSVSGGESAVPVLRLSAGELLSDSSGPRAGEKPNRKLASADQLATIVYTSGTTGRPKGVMLSAANLLSNVRAIIDYLKLSAEDRGLCVLPFYYAYGNSVLHTHLAVGASLVLENSFVYPQRVLERMSAEAVTGFAGVPSTYRLLLRRCDLDRFPMPQLRYVTQAGGALAVADVRAIKKAWPSAQFVVMYGQTEATARLSYLPPDRLEEKAGSVGVPIPGVRLKIMDDRGREKDCGETGEICAAGPNIMLGYWRDPENTEKKFFGEWLRTGDLGYCDRDGFFTLVGRRSDMIKTGDHRVAPEEVEQVIGALDEVEEVAVVGAPDDLLGQVIKAFVVPVSGSELNKRSILRHCREHCAQYKIPKEVEFVSELPRTASGKVQRHKLLDARDADTRAASGQML